MGHTAPLLQMAGICKSFGSAQVLREVDLRLDAGEVLALLGANGAGKSTLVKILCGVYSRDAGTVRLADQAVRYDRPEEAIAHGVRFLPQEVSVLPDLTVAENILIADLPLKRSWLSREVDRTALRAKARALLDRLGCDLDPDAPVHQLSAPHKRLVEIARALAGQARVIVMDEPTAALADREVQALFAVVERLKAQQIGIIYISHYLDEVFEIADRITVLRDGLNAGDFATATASRRDVLDAMLGTTVDELYPPRGASIGEVALKVENLSLTSASSVGPPGALDSVSFAIHQGEILGVFGLLGSGIDQLGRAIYGRTRVRCPAHALRSGVRPIFRLIRVGAATRALVSSPPNASARASSPISASAPISPCPLSTVSCACFPCPNPAKQATRKAGSTA